MKESVYRKTYLFLVGVKKRVLLKLLMGAIVLGRRFDIAEEEVQKRYYTCKENNYLSLSYKFV